MMLNGLVSLAFVGSVTAAAVAKFPFSSSHRHVPHPRPQDVDVPSTSVSAAPLPTSVVVNFTNAADPFDFNVVNLMGDDQVVYTANITVDGKSYEVSTPSPFHFCPLKLCLAGSIGHW